MNATHIKERARAWEQEHGSKSMGARAWEQEHGSKSMGARAMIA